MANLNMLLLVSALMQITVSSPVGSSDQCPSFTPLATNINDFGFQLSSRLDRTGNQFISPFSVYTAIAMAYTGARGNTAKEIEEALQLGRDGLTGSDLQHSFKALLDGYLNSNGDYSLETANGLFLQNGYPVKEDYVQNLKSFYQALVKQLDFAGAGEAARREINEFVANSTHDKIKEMLSDPLSHLTRLVLLNAVYFKGTWKTQFSKEATFDRIFYKSADERKQVKMMNIAQQSFPFYEDSETGYKYLELPYKGDDIVMLLALPRSAQDFPDLPMSSSQLCDVFAKLKNEKLDTVGLPKFSLEYEKELKDSLVALGIRDLFTGSSDLTGISDERNLAVSSVLHKAVIDVNEEGSEAAAATSVVIVKLALFPTTDFVADHPFLFYIVDKRNGLVLFSGRVTDP